MSATPDVTFATPAIPATRSRKRRVIDGEELREGTASRSTKLRKENNSATRKASVIPTHQEDENSLKTLFGKIKNGKSVATVADEWITNYNSNPEGALQEICQFLISSSGCRGVLALNLIKQGNFKNILVLLTDCFNDETTDYPLISTSVQYKKFKQNFGDFLVVFASKCKSNILYDQTLMDSICQLLTAMADSEVRAFRHTSTYASMKLCSSFVDIVVSLIVLKEKNAKQIETASNRTTKERDTERLAALTTVSNDFNSRISDLTDMMSYLFRSIFVHRYRDYVSDIRCVCISHLGLWMLVYPEHFLTDSYLKYISWSIYDTTFEVRLACLNALAPLYEKAVNASKLELFTTRFLERICSMVSDVNIDIGIKACQLLKSVAIMFPDVMTSELSEPIYEYVFTSNRGLAAAAGEFLTFKLFTPASNSEGGNEELLPSLLMFLKEANIHNHASYLVDSLIDHHPMIKDYQAMVDILLSDDHEEYDVYLCQVFAAAVKQACTGEYPAGRGLHVKKHNTAQSGKDAKVQNDERAKVSEAIIPALAKLLQKLITNEECLVELSCVATFIQVDLFMAKRWDNHLDEIIEVFGTIVEQSINVEVLSNIVHTLHQFQSDASVTSKIQVFHQTITHRLTVQLKQDVARYVNEDMLDDDERCSLIAALTKVYAFLTRDVMCKWEIWEIVAPIFRMQNKQHALDITIPAFNCLSQYIVKQLRTVIAAGEGRDDNENLKDVKNLDTQVVELFAISNGILAKSDPKVDDIYFGVVDILILIDNSNVIKASGAKVKITFDIDTTLATTLVNYVMTTCFGGEGVPRNISQEDSFCYVHRKRAVLTCFCKLIVYGCLPITYSHHILQYYLQYQKEFGDIMKHVVQKCRETNIAQYAKAIKKAIITAFEKVKAESGDKIDPVTSKKFGELKELAKKFNQSFGLDQIKNRNAIATIHRDGILYSLNDNDNILFLEVLLEFSPRLLPQDKSVIYNYLINHCGKDESEITENPLYQPYLLYKQSLC
uniref:SCD domain-containing protein n=1 Tax=Rhabditophanes sp. KR3021 TaxID=114890 RepID=A0AC35TSF4_9BILA